MLSLTPVSFISLASRRYHGDVERDGGNEPPPLPPLLGLSALVFLMILSHTGGKLYLPPSLLRLGFRALTKLAFFTPPSNHLESVVKISVFSNAHVVQGECVLQPLGLRSSLNLDFRDLSASPTYITSHSSQLIFYM